MLARTEHKHKNVLMWQKLHVVRQKLHGSANKSKMHRNCAAQDRNFLVELTSRLVHRTALSACNKNKQAPEKTWRCIIYIYISSLHNQYNRVVQNKHKTKLSFDQFVQCGNAAGRFHNNSNKQIHKSTESTQSARFTRPVGSNVCIHPIPGLVKP